MTPKLSIITINLNNASGLRKTIESVIVQSFKSYEYIIIDGGSSDGSIDVINEFAKKLTYWVSESDDGIYQAMNKGILKSNGDYILFLNSGDWLVKSNILYKVKQYLDKADILFGDLINCYAPKADIKEIRFPDNLTFDFFLTSSIPHPASFIRRQLFKEIGLYNENLRIVADWEFFVLAIIKNNCTYLHLNFPVSVYNMNGISENPSYRHLLASEVKNSLEHYFPRLLPDYDELHRLKKEMKLMKRKFKFKLKHSIIRNKYSRYIFNKLT